LPDTTAPVVNASPAGGSFQGTISVTLSGTDDSLGVVTIHYTTDGTTPTIASPVYSSPINVTTTTTISFFGVDPSNNQSAIQTMIYTIFAPDTTPPIITISPTQGTYTSSQVITLQANENSVIYYTKDGTTPTTSSPVYEGSFTISALGTTTVKYFGVDFAGNASTVQTTIYTLNLPVAIAPVFSKTNGYSDSAQRIVIGGNSKGGITSGNNSPTIAAQQKIYIRFLFKGILPNYVYLTKASGNQKFTNITVNPMLNSDWQEAIGSITTNNVSAETIGSLIAHDNTGVLDSVTIDIDETYLSNFDYYAITEHVEWIPLGRYFITQWKNDNTSKVVTFTGNDYFKIFSDTNYAPSAITNLHDLAADVLTKAGVPANDQYIDASLSGITVGAFKQNVDSRSAIQQIAIAAQCCVYQDRYGNIVISPFSTIDKVSNYLSYPTTQNLLPMPYSGPSTYPLMSTGSGLRNIKYNDMYNPPAITLEQVVRQVTVKVYDTNGNPMPDAIYTNPNVTGIGGTSFSIDNALVISVPMATKIANWYFEETNYSAIFNINWRQNPALECTDVVLLQDPFNSGKQSRIIHQEFDYQGYLVGTTDSRGGI